MADAGEDGEKEMRFRGVRKRKWGKYVAEIRSGKRSRISLGSYFTPHAAARAYDTALLCLRGPNVTCFNFPDSQFNLEVANTETNPSPQAIRTAAIAVGSAYDVVPGGYFRDNNNQIFEDAANQEQPAQGGETINDQRNRLVEEKMAEEQVIYELTDAESHVQSAQRILSDQSIQTTFNFMI